MLPLAVGVGAAAVTVILIPILALVFLRMFGFSVVGHIASKSSPKRSLFDPTGHVKPELFRIN